MTNEFSIIKNFNVNTEGLPKTVDILLNRFGNIAGVCLPFLSKKLSDKRTRDKIARAKSDMEVLEIKARCFNRLEREATIHQANLENIIRKAIPDLRDNAKPKQISNDWLLNFVDKAKLISDANMQKLWAKILAGEANKPESFSKRTIEALFVLEPEEAKIFNALCSFVVSHNNFYRPIILEYNNPIYKDEKIVFSSLIHLDEIGLISFISDGELMLSLPKEMKFDFFGKKIKLTLPQDNDNQFSVGCVKFSHVGQELSKICGAKPKKGFLDYLTKQWQRYNIEIESET